MRSCISVLKEQLAFLDQMAVLALLVNLVYLVHLEQLEMKAFLATLEIQVSEAAPGNLGPQVTRDYKGPLAQLDHQDQLEQWEIRE